VSGLWNVWTEHWVTLPLVLPLLGGFATTVVPRNWMGARRSFAMLVLFATCASSAVAVDVAATGQITTYEVSGWAAPFGIVLVVDRLSAALVTTTSVLAIAAFLYAIFRDDQRSDHFHFLFLVQLAGLNGAFLTGDLFNLFVFFEVLLIASYNLLVYGGGEGRTRAGIHYAVLNLTGSALFLVGVGVLYGLTGTLNMADLGVALGNLDPQNAALARSGAMVLMVVFGLKSALLPLYFWLPRAYGNATAPVAALFAIMTKVGIYAILRTSTLLFGYGHGVTSHITGGWLLPLALATLAFGVLGVAASRRLRTMVAYLVIVSVGTILAPIAAAASGRPEPIGAALYYLIHSTFVTGALFLLADVIVSMRGEAEDALDAGPGIASPSWLAVLFFAAAVVVVGLPPTSGFVGKVLVLESFVGHESVAWAWAVILGGSLLTLVALALAGSRLFWETEEESVDGPIEEPGRVMAPIVLLGVVAGWTIFAGPAHDYLRATGAQLLDRQSYFDAVDPQEFDPSEVEHHDDSHH